MRATVAGMPSRVVVLDTPVFGEAPAAWRDNLPIYAKALGKEDEGRRLLGGLGASLVLDMLAETLSA